MTLQDYNQMFQNRLELATRKSDIRSLKKFVGILTDLEKRELPIDKKEAIVKELNRLESEANARGKGKSNSRKVNSFVNFLKKNYSLVTQGYYRTLGLVLGMSMGTGFGVALGTSLDPAKGTSIGLAMGTGFGMAIGIAIGAAKDKQALAEGRVMDVK